MRRRKEIARQWAEIYADRDVEPSAHCAPQISAHACTALWHLRHLEYFHDHVRIEHLLFDGCLEAAGGRWCRTGRSRATA